MMKKVIIRLAQVAVFLAIVFGCVFAGTMAYLSHTRKGVHPISYGENENAITESFQPPKEMTAGANIFEKSVRIKNSGSTDSFVRVFLDFSDYAAGSRSYFAVEKPGTVSVAEGATQEEAKASLEAAGFIAYDDFYVGGDERNGWVYVPEDEDAELGGYFYYTGIVEPGKSTDELINSVCTYFETAAEVVPYQIYVYSESVQTYDKDGRPYDAGQWKEAWKEFLERK